MSKRTLLLADDSVTIQKVVNLTFADEGIDVVTVGDGDSAMQKISELSPDVVLADVHMPGLSGYQICEIVRGNPDTRNLPVVLLVGSFEPFDEGEAARVGANAYLTKPFQSIRQLVTQVTDLMQSASPEPAESEVVESEIDAIEHPQPAKVRDTTDIDSLYHQSFGGPSAEVETPAEQSEVAEHSYNEYGDETYAEAQPDTPAAPYVDAGMDDEMIETSHVGGIEQPPPVFAQGQTEYEEPAQSEQSWVPTTESEYTTEPQYSVNPNTTPEQTAYEETQVTGWAAPMEQQPTSAGAFDSFAEERFEPTASEETPAEPVAEFDEFSRTEQIPASITASAFNLDDLELLDLPPLENGKTQEFTTTQRSEAEGGGKEITSMSSELMDILVQRVVDKLSKDK